MQGEARQARLCGVQRMTVHTGTPSAPVEEKTFWERAAETRWGAYMTEREREALLLASSLADRPALAVDVGCEGGRWSRLLHDAGWDLVCTDVNPETLALCDRRLPEATFLLTDPSATRIPVGDAAARLLLVSEVAPVSQSPWFPDEAARVLEPSGILVCTFYNPASARGMAYRLLRRIEAWRGRPGVRFHEHFYGGRPYAEFRKALRHRGFRVVYEEGLCWFPFSRQSDASLVPLCTALEARLGLRRLTTLSPFVIVIAQKRVHSRRNTTRGPRRTALASSPASTPSTANETKPPPGRPAALPRFHSVSTCARSHC